MTSKLNPNYSGWNHTSRLFFHPAPSHRLYTRRNLAPDKDQSLHSKRFYRILYSSISKRNHPEAIHILPLCVS